MLLLAPASVLLTNGVRLERHIMTLPTFNIVFPLGFPIAMPSGGGQRLPHASAPAAAQNSLTTEEHTLLKPLHARWLGSGLDAAKRSWSWLTGAAQQAGKTLPTVDLLFPFVYGGALAVNLWWVWETLGHPFHPAWIVAPLAIIVMADWAENLLQLAQRRHSGSSHEDRIQNLWLEISACATIIKLWLALGLYVSLVGLVVKFIVVRSHRRLTVNAAI